MCVTVNDVLYFTNLVKINAPLQGSEKGIMKKQNAAKPDVTENFFESCIFVPLVGLMIMVSSYQEFSTFQRGDELFKLIFSTA